MSLEVKPRQTTANNFKRLEQVVAKPIAKMGSLGNMLIQAASRGM